MTTAPDEVRTRLVDCFAAVLTDVSEDAIPTATVESVDSWDSLASISLVAVIEEEFDVELPEDEIRTMTSFEAAADVVTRLVAADA